MALESFWFELAGIGHQSVKVTAAGGSVLRPQWFAPFLADRGTRKPSPHTMKAYRQDFEAIAALIVGSKGDLAAMSLGDITTKAMRGAFAQYAETHKAASIQRRWWTWNVLCAFLYTSDLIPANPMPLVGRPKIAKTLPKGLPPTSVQALLAAVDSESERRASDWMERDRALILTSLLAGLRADELLRANVGDVRRREDGAIIQVRGKGGKDRSIPVELALVEVLVEYLDSRAVRFPATARGRSSTVSGLAAWPPTAPLFVRSDGDRITRVTLQYRVLRAFRRAGIDEDRARGALVHVLRHTFATELASAGVSVFALCDFSAMSPWLLHSGTSPPRELKLERPQRRTGFTSYSRTRSSRSRRSLRARD